MKNVFLILALFIISLSASASPNTRQLYSSIGLGNIMSYELFEKGIRGYEMIDKKTPIITFIDFSKASTDKRLYVIDLKNKKLLYHTYVSHGRNSGDNYAKSFSNISGSNKSSLGFFLTKETYSGKNGYSLRLDGLEKGINDKAMERAIVIHGAKYSNPETIEQNGRLGRSLGCPAIPTDISKNVIDTIKDGSVLFIYANDESYVKQSLFV